MKAYVSTHKDVNVCRLTTRQVHFGVFIDAEGPSRLYEEIDMQDLLEEQCHIAIGLSLARPVLMDSSSRVAKPRHARETKTHRTEELHGLSGTGERDL